MGCAPICPVKDAGARECPALLHRLVIARRTARLAVPQPIVTHARIDLRLAEAAELFAFAAARDLFTLRANDFGLSRCGHK